MKDFIYIDTGRDTRMYTLRQHTEYPDGSVCDDYIINLSTDWDRAVFKAKNYAIATKCDICLPDQGFSLEEIRRKARDAESTSREASEAAKRAAADENTRILDEEMDLQIMTGVLPFGKFVGEDPADVWVSNPGYIRWAMKNAPQPIPMIISNAIGDAWKFKPGNVGAVGDKGVLITGRVISARQIQPQFYGAASSVLFVIMTTDTKKRIALFTAAASFDEVYEGDTITFKGTIKSHSSFDGEDQTTISRPKLYTPDPDPPIGGFIGGVYVVN